MRVRFESLETFMTETLVAAGPYNKEDRGDRTLFRGKTPELGEFCAITGTSSEVQVVSER